MVKTRGIRVIRTFVWVLLALTACFYGCNPNIESNPNEASGGDGERGRARAMDLDTPVNDNVNLTGGDMTDWKFFQIPAPGTVEITLGCDNEGAACAAVVRDSMGVEIQRIDSNGEPRVQETVPVIRGNYYLEVFAQASSTDYTVQVDYEPN